MLSFSIVFVLLCDKCSRKRAVPRQVFGKIQFVPSPGNKDISHFYYYYCALNNCLDLQVNGEVYAVNEFTLLIKNFIYDGNGPDTFFWTGSSTRPGPQGFIVPNERGRTNVLQPYLNKDFTLTLPEGKKITSIKWLAVYDLTLQVGISLKKKKYCIYLNPVLIILCCTGKLW